MFSVQLHVHLFWKGPCMLVHVLYIQYVYQKSLECNNMSTVYMYIVVHQKFETFTHKILLSVEAHEKFNAMK